MLSILPPLSNSRKIWTGHFYVALNITSIIDCYWVGAVPNINSKPSTRSPKVSWGLGAALRPRWKVGLFMKVKVTVVGSDAPILGLGLKV